MQHPLRRLLAVSASAAVLATLGPASLTAPSPALAQQEAATAAEAPAKSRGRGREKKKAVSAPGMQQATPVAIFGDWNVFANGQGKSRTCYAIAQPQARTPKTLKRDTAYLFVTIRKGDNVQNEVAVMFGFPPKPAASQAKANATAASDPILSLGSSQYGWVVKDENAWLQNPSEEARLVGEMAKLAKVQVKDDVHARHLYQRRIRVGGLRRRDQTRPRGMQVRPSLNEARECPLPLTRAAGPR